MSDQAIRALTEAVAKLSLTTERLAERVDLLLASSPPAASFQSSPTPEYPQGTIRELSRNPFPAAFLDYCRSVSLRGPEDGPPDTPECCLALAKERLSGKEPGYQKRADFAFDSGFWARVALDTETEYKTCTLLQGLKSHHWVVLRSTHSCPFRKTSRGDACRLCNFRDPNLILATFDSLAEVEIFCLAAQVAIPILKTC